MSWRKLDKVLYSVGNARVWADGLWLSRLVYEYVSGILSAAYWVYETEAIVSLVCRPFRNSPLGILNKVDR